MIIGQLFRQMRGLTPEQQNKVIQDYRRSVEAGHARLCAELDRRNGQLVREPPERPNAREAKKIVDGLKHKYGS